MHKSAQPKPGKALAFFNSPSSKREIRHELPYIRDFAQIHPLLELTPTSPSKLMRNREYRAFAKQAKSAGIKHVLKAKLPGSSNFQTARDELGPLLNQLFQSPLYSDSHQFRGGIIYALDQASWVHVREMVVLMARGTLIELEKPYPVPYITPPAGHSVIIQPKG